MIIPATASITAVLRRLAAPGGLVLALAITAAAADSAMLRIPAFTAFVEPDPGALQVSEQTGVTGWTDGRQRVFWCGKLGATGRLNVSVEIRLAPGSTSKLRLKVDGRTRVAQASGGARPLAVSFGSVMIPSAGYYRFTLEGLARSGPTFGNLDALLLDGPAAANAHFNLRPEQRGAPSVHLSYSLPSATSVAWFYNEVTARADPVATYYMACGWRRGYFGIQVNSPTERRIIFSVWDSGNEPRDRGRVAQDRQVRLVAKGEGVFVGGFGNEGTGMHSHLVYPWKKGQTYRLLVTATPMGTDTTYAGYFYFPEKRKWGLIAAFRAPQDGDYLRGLYSFDEDFWPANGYLQRLAEFGNQWVLTADGQWQELTEARFTHTGGSWRTDYDAGAVRDRFYLAGGGFKDGAVAYGDRVRRPPSGNPPAGIVLPPLPAAIER